MNETTIALSLVTGLAAGALFKFLEIPIPAPPNLAGIMGIVGIFLGFKLIESLGWNVTTVLEALGI